MARLTSAFVVFATALAATVGAAPLASSQSSAPATVSFTPYAFYCEMSQNPHDPTKPSSYNLTSSTGCITPPYSFISYVESANALALQACSVSLYSGPKCTGSVSAAKLTSDYECQIPNASFQSVQMACGP